MCPASWAFPTKSVDFFPKFQLLQMIVYFYYHVMCLLLLLFFFNPALNPNNISVAVRAADYAHIAYSLSNLCLFSFF